MYVDARLKHHEIICHFVEIIDLETNKPIRYVVWADDKENRFGRHIMDEKGFPKHDNDGFFIEVVERPIMIRIRAPE